MKKNYAMLLLALFTLTFLGPGAYGQSKTVSGKVIDESDGTSLPGVNIIEPGTTNGTITDVDGNFSLTVTGSNPVLVFSYVGYSPQEIAVGERTTIEVSLSADMTQLGEVVVMGYGTLDRKEVSSAVVNVTKEDFIQAAVSNPMDLVVGKVAGLTVSSTAAANPNASEDGAQSIQIRGATSLFAGNEPLIVINGIPGGSLSSLAPQDIESITVLKDGASASIYGTRGANGVILITTNQGSTGSGEFSLNYNSWFGVNTIRRKPRVLTADEFREHRSHLTDYGGNTDWYDAIMNDFSYDNNQYVGFSGSMPNGWYNASLNYKNATGMETGNERWEYGGLFDMTQMALKGLLEFKVSLNLRMTKADDRGGNFGGMLTRNPTIPIYNDDGTYFHSNDNATRNNPIEAIHENTSFINRQYLRASTGATLNLIENQTHMLNTGVTFQFEQNTRDAQSYEPSTLTLINEAYAGIAELENEIELNKVVNWITNYSLRLSDHNVKAMAGYSYQDFTTTERTMENSNFAFDDFLWNDIGAGTFLPEGNADMSSDKTLYKLIAMFGRVNYNWKDLLFATASLRYEGSTKFGTNNKWGYFPAASAGIEMANTSFLQTNAPVINSLKLRASYGVTGRSNFDSYNSLATYSSESFYNINGTWVNGYQPSRNPNPDLRWEKGINTNLGIDFALLDRRLTGSVDVFTRRSKDLLYNYNAPQPPMIYNTILVNVGTVVNRGIEVSLGARIIESKTFSWNSDLNFSTGKTNLESLSNDVYGASFLEMYQKPGIGTTEHLFRYEEGGEIGRYYGYRHAGISEDGNLQVYDQNGEVISKGQEQNEDKVFLGSAVPKAFFSWNNTLRYGKFDLNVFFTSALGFKILNFADYGIGFHANTNDNVLLRAYTERAHITGDPAILSSFHLHDGSYLKVENITLGYQTNFASDYIERLRVFIAARNVHTFTSYEGRDPSAVSVNGLTPGVDTNGAYPVAIQFSLGVNANF
jgi:TonB-dependent starch-binding outer membrane protein SusC